MIRHLELKQAPTAVLYRLQGVVAAIVGVLLLLLPLAFPVKLTLVIMLGVSVIIFIRQRGSCRGIQALLVDADQQRVFVLWQGSQAQPELLSCAVRYFSQGLVMLAYRRPMEVYFGCRHLRRTRPFPVFSSMLSGEDYRRLLAVVRSRQ